jgi:hypothetical protein
MLLRCLVRKLLFGTQVAVSFNLCFLGKSYCKSASNTGLAAILGLGGDFVGFEESL